MSVSRPARCLFSGTAIPRVRPALRCRSFHASPNLYKKKKKANTPANLFREYTAEERLALEKKYTPAQLAAIEAGEAAIDPKDLHERGVVRTDIGALDYFDDLSKLRPVVDRKDNYEGPIDPAARLMTGDEMMESHFKTWDAAKLEDPPLPNARTMSREEWEDLDFQKKESSALAMMKADDRAPMFMGTNGPIPIEHTTSFMAPELPRMFDDEDGKKKIEVKESEEEDADPRDPEGVYNKLIKQTGLTLDQILEYKVKILVQHRVVNQTRLGKIQSLYALAVAGNGNGRLGIGEAKGQETEETSSKARIAAIRAMQPIPRYEERTIYGEVEGKVAAVKVKLMTRPPGKLILLSALYIC